MRGRRAVPAVLLGLLAVAAGCSVGDPGDVAESDGGAARTTALWPGPSSPLGEQGPDPWSRPASSELSATGIRVVARPGAESLAVDGAGRAWLWGPWHVARVDPHTGAGRVWDVGDDVSLGQVRGIRPARQGVWLVHADRVRHFDGTRFVQDLAVPPAFRGGPDGVLADVVEVGSEVWVASPRGVARWANGAWGPVRPEQLTRVTTLAADRSGSVWAAGRLAADDGAGPAVVRFDGPGWVSPDPPDAPRSAEEIVADPTGGVLVRHGASVRSFDGTSWTRYPAVPDAGGAGSSSTASLAVTGDGVPWLIVDRGLLRGGPQGWTPVPADAPTRLVAVASDGDAPLATDGVTLYRVGADGLGAVWTAGPVGPVASRAGVARHSGRDPEPWSVGETIEIGPEGLVAVSGDEVWARPRGYPLVSRLSGSAWQEWELPAAGWEAPVLATDGALWLGTEQGVVRVSGSERARFSTIPGSGQGRAGPDGSVWVLPPEWYGWWYADGYEDEVPEYLVIRHVQPDGTATEVPMPDYPWSLGSVVAGSDGTLWGLVCVSGVVTSCPDPPDLMRWDGAWAPVPYPAAGIEPIGVATDGGLWAVLVQPGPSPGADEPARVLARYVDGRWTALVESGVPQQMALAPDGSVCGLDDIGPDLLCVAPTGGTRRAAVGLAGEVGVAPDGAVWVVGDGLVARLPGSATG